MKKRYLVGLACGVMMLGVVEVAGATPIQWAVADGGNGHWYELVDNNSQITWASADVAAEASTYLGSNGYLVSITSSAENDWVHHNIVMTTSSWLGGSQAANGDQGSWQWSSGENWGFTAWEIGQPDNFAGGIQHTLYYNPTDGPKWDDAPDHWNGIPNAYVVEYPQAPVPEPATMLLMGTGLAGLVGARRKKKK